jgi:hypothetical protein
VGAEVTWSSCVDCATGGRCVVTAGTEPLAVLTYRDLAVELTPQQIDRWTRWGYLRSVNPRPGSGVPRLWLPGELEVAVRMVSLLECGLTLRAAHYAARNDGRLPGDAWRVEKETS